MCRCVACNKILDPETSGRKEDGTLEDMCSTCRYFAGTEYDILDKEYHHNELTKTINNIASYNED